MMQNVWPGGRGVYATDIGLKFGTSPKSHHVDDAGSSPVRAETFTGYPTAKSTYRLNFLLIVVWLGVQGVQATYIGFKTWDFP